MRNDRVVFMEEFFYLQLFAGEGVSGGGDAAGGAEEAPVGGPLGKNRKSFRREREGFTDSPEEIPDRDGRASNARPYGDGFDYTEQAAEETDRNRAAKARDENKAGTRALAGGPAARAAKARNENKDVSSAVEASEPDRDRAAQAQSDHTDGSCALAGGPAARAAQVRNDDTDVSGVLKEHFRRLEGEAEQMREVFPGFDLRRELRDPRFAALTAPGMGVSVEDAYYALHRRELQAASMQVAARSAARKIASSIQSAARRPVENSGESAAPAGIGAQNLSREQREVLRQRIHNAAAMGEKIYP